MSCIFNLIFGFMMMVGLIFVFGVLVVYCEFEGMIVFLIVVFFLFVVWIFIEIVKCKEERNECFYENQVSICWLILAVGFLMVVFFVFMLVIFFGIIEVLGDDLEKWIMGVLFGIIFLFYGNVVLK